MRVFKRLRALRAFDRQHLGFLSAGGDHHLIAEIGQHQASGKPLTLKQLFLLDVGSVATVQRRLRRLKGLGLVQSRRAENDRRSVELTLSPKCVRMLAKYEAIMTSTLPAQGRGESSHVCGLCDSDAGCRNLLAMFLAQGLKRGDKCLLVAPAEAQKEILMKLNDRRKAPRQLIASEGYASADAHLAFLKRVLQEAKRAGQRMCLAADMSWTLAKNVPVDVMLDIVKRFDAMAGRLPLSALRIYDTRHFSSGDLLRAMKCHRDHARHPIVLG